NPTAAETVTATWPADPLGRRRALLDEAAALVRAAPRELKAVNVADDPWAQEVELLLAERAAFTPDPRAPVEVVLPAHLSVSQLVALRRDPETLARTLRRPLPTRPDRYARRGTAFHLWLERRFGTDQLLDRKSVG